MYVCYSLYQITSQVYVCMLQSLSNNIKVYVCMLQSLSNNIKVYVCMLQSLSNNITSICMYATVVAGDLI